MTDPLAFVLWHILGTHDVLTPSDLYEFDSARAEAVMTDAGMMNDEISSAWVVTAATADWYERTWNELRHARPTPHIPPTGDPEAGLSEEVSPACAEPALSKAGCAVPRAARRATKTAVISLPTSPGTHP